MCGDEAAGLIVASLAAAEAACLRCVDYGTYFVYGEEGLVRQDLDVGNWSMTGTGGDFPTAIA